MALPCDTDWLTLHVQGNHDSLQVESTGSLALLKISAHSCGLFHGGYPANLHVTRWMSLRKTSYWSLHISIFVSEMKFKYLNLPLTSPPCMQISRVIEPSSALHRGASAPAGPAAPQWLLHPPPATGRAILWNALISSFRGGVYAVASVSRAGVGAGAVVPAEYHVQVPPVPLQPQAPPSTVGSLLLPLQLAASVSCPLPLQPPPWPFLLFLPCGIGVRPSSGPQSAHCPSPAPQAAAGVPRQGVPVTAGALPSWLPGPPPVHLLSPHLASPVCSPPHAHLCSPRALCPHS